MSTSPEPICPIDATVIDEALVNGTAEFAIAVVRTRDAASTSEPFHRIGDDKLALVHLPVHFPLTLFERVLGRSHGVERSISTPMHTKPRRSSVLRWRTR